MGEVDPAHASWKPAASRLHMKSILIVSMGLPALMAGLVMMWWWEECCSWEIPDSEGMPGPLIAISHRLIVFIELGILGS